jgi:hypothetical protein
MLKTGLREGAAKEEMREQLRRIVALLNEGIDRGEADPNLREVTKKLLIIVTAMPDRAFEFDQVFTRLLEATDAPTLLFKVFAVAGPTIQLHLRSNTAKGAEPEVRRLLHEQKMEGALPKLHVRPRLTRLLNAVGQSLGLGKIALEYSDREYRDHHVDMRHSRINERFVELQLPDETLTLAGAYRVAGIQLAAGAAIANHTPLGDEIRRLMAEGPTQ